ncbi:hypothetical protein COCON_G00211230 [Conger conger]|uniref:RRM domain-containing protein n=1 Tax=Conger conger TaxID=82655 RepID=A0A9Q1HQT9_CONCO|nr:hypothetical protein COCON_G00211230 [Conger conger]
MAQPFPPPPFPPQTCLQAEFGAPHPAQDYTGQGTVPEAPLGLYPPTATPGKTPGSECVPTPASGGVTTPHIDEVTHTEGPQLHLQQTEPSEKLQPKRLHVSNIPFRFRDPDLQHMFGQIGSSSVIYEDGTERHFEYSPRQQRREHCHTRCRSDNAPTGDDYPREQRGILEFTE